MNVSGELGYIGTPYLGGVRRRIPRMPKKKKSIIIIIAIIVVLVLFITAIIIIYIYTTKTEEEGKGGDGTSPPGNGTPTATFSAWSDWVRCSKDCGGGTQTRTRTCTGPNTTICNAVPPALLTSTQSCNNVACPPTFSNWGTCSPSCGTGTQTRTCTANCVGVPASDLSRSCNNVACPPTFSNWGTCSKDCGTGTQTRTCTANCVGVPTSDLNRTCNTFACPTISAWSACSRSCGDGVETRTCTGDSALCMAYMATNPMSRPCNLGPCAPPPITLGELTSHPWKMPSACTTGGCIHVQFMDLGNSSVSGYQAVSFKMGIGPTFANGYTDYLKQQHTGFSVPQDYVELKRGTSSLTLFLSGYVYKIYRDINDNYKLKIYNNEDRTTKIIEPV